MLSRNYLGRLITRDNDAGKIAGYISDVSWSIQSFLVSITVILLSVDRVIENGHGSRPKACSPSSLHSM